MPINFVTPGEGVFTYLPPVDGISITISNGRIYPVGMGVLAKGLFWRAILGGVDSFFVSGEYVT